MTKKFKLHTENLSYIRDSGIHSCLREIFGEEVEQTFINKRGRKKHIEINRRKGPGEYETKFAGNVISRDELPDTYPCEFTLIIKHKGAFYRDKIITYKNGNYKRDIEIIIKEEEKGEDLSEKLRKELLY